MPALKLIRLLDTPDEIKFLAPLIIREIIYRLLKGEQGARLSHLLVSERDTRCIFQSSRAAAPRKSGPTLED